MDYKSELDKIKQNQTKIANIVKSLDKGNPSHIRQYQELRLQVLRLDDKLKEIRQFLTQMQRVAKKNGGRGLTLIKGGKHPEKL